MMKEEASILNILHVGSSLLIWETLVGGFKKQTYSSVICLRSFLKMLELTSGWSTLIVTDPSWNVRSVSIPVSSLSWGYLVLLFVLSHITFKSISFIPISLMSSISMALTMK